VSAVIASREAARQSRNIRLDCFASLAMTKLTLIASLLLLAACRKDEPTAPSAEQSARLNETEDMLNGLAANEEGPEDRSSSPSNNSG
jgi:uncharacterized lipoprotein YajG